MAENQFTPQEIPSWIHDHPKVHHAPDIPEGENRVQEAVYLDNQRQRNGQLHGICSEFRFEAIL